MWGRVIAFVVLCFPISQAVEAQGLTGQFETLLSRRDSDAGARAATQGAQFLAPNLPIPADLDLPRTYYPVEFQPQTALLTANGMTVLRDLALALNGEALRNSVFQVGAHLGWDASASNAVPAQTLSTLRAQTVVNHLVAFYGIDPRRLIPIGYGQTTPAVGLVPTDPQNERIELINVDDLVR